MIVTYDPNKDGKNLTQKELQRLKELDPHCDSFKIDDPELTEELAQKIKDNPWSGRLSSPQTSINCKAVVNHLAGRANNDFERKRNEAEYNRMSDHIREIADEPFYRWSKEERKHPNK